MVDIKLTSLQKKVLLFFSENSFGKNFYWTGGTLLSSHYLHHRDSVDLDFFSDNLFTDDEYLNFINALKKETGANKVTLIKQYNRRLYLIKKESEAIKLELVYFPFSSVEKREKSPDFSVQIDSLTDIMVNKILSTYQRNEPKDVFDLYCYLSQKPKRNFPKLIKLVEKKFGVAIEPVILLAKMNKLANDLNSLSPLFLNPQKNISAKVKNFFQEIFNSLAKKQIK